MGGGTMSADTTMPPGLLAANYPLSFLAPLWTLTQEAAARLEAMLSRPDAEDWRDDELTQVFAEMKAVERDIMDTASPTFGGVMLKIGVVRALSRNPDCLDLVRDMVASIEDDMRRLLAEGPDHGT